MEKTNYHNAVLLKQSVDGLNIKPDGVYVDVTFGGGGHSKEILNRLGAHGKLFAFDQDDDALKNAIDDDRFVLIGRGVYALKNWGYKDGTVVEVVEDILRERKEALSREDIVKEVLKQREVKPNTIYLALNRSDRVNKTADGRYIITNNI